MSGHAHLLRFPAGIPWIVWEIAVHYSTFAAAPRRNLMATTKTATLTFRIDPGLKEALRTAAAHEHRSIANMVEMLIREHCGRNGIAIPQNNDRPDTKYKK